MNENRFFRNKGEVIEVVSNIYSMLNANSELFSREVMRSPRAMGDIIQETIEDNLGEIIGKFSSEYSADFARRAMADVAFTDKGGNYCVVDVKTHNKSTDFNMPNLISVDRLARFYEDDKNTFAILMIGYSVKQDKLAIENEDIIFCPIEFISWRSLTLGALGWGQIQIANSNSICVSDNHSRKTWMISLCERLMEFYPKEIEKITKRLERFKTLKNDWEKRNDIWAQQP